MSLGRRAEQFQHPQACIRVCCCFCLILVVHIILSLNNQLSRIQDKGVLPKEQMSSHFFLKLVLIVFFLSWIVDEVLTKESSLVGVGSKSRFS